MKQKVKKQEETQAQLEARVRRELKAKQHKDAAAKEKQREKEDKKIHTLSGKALKDLSIQLLNQGIRQGKLELLEKQIKEKEEAEAKPVTIADQLKDLEEKIKYARSKELEKIQDRKLISLINSVSHELEITLRSLLALEERGLNIFISRKAYENQLKKSVLKSRINSTTRKNLNIIAWSVENLRVCIALLGLGNSTQDFPVELYPVSKSDHNKEVKKYFKLVEKRKRKAEAELKKQEKE